jgi:hypothetical protein
LSKRGACPCSTRRAPGGSGPGCLLSPFARPVSPGPCCSVGRFAHFVTTSYAHLRALQPHSARVCPGARARVAALSLPSRPVRPFYEGTSFGRNARPEARASRQKASARWRTGRHKAVGEQSNYTASAGSTPQPHPPRPAFHPGIHVAGAGPLRSGDVRAASAIAALARRHGVVVAGGAALRGRGDVVDAGRRAQGGTSRGRPARGVLEQPPSSRSKFGEIGWDDIGSDTRE